MYIYIYVCVCVFFLGYMHIYTWNSKQPTSLRSGYLVISNHFLWCGVIQLKLTIKKWMLQLPGIYCSIFQYAWPFSQNVSQRQIGRLKVQGLFHVFHSKNPKKTTMTCLGEVHSKQYQTKFHCISSGQIIICHQPKFRWNSRWFPFQNATFWGPRSCEVAIIWPDFIRIPWYIQANTSLRWAMTGLWLVNQPTPRNKDLRRPY